MDWFKWFVCWWNRRHIPMFMYGRDGARRRICARCGMELGL